MLAAGNYKTGGKIIALSATASVSFAISLSVVEIQ